MSPSIPAEDLFHLGVKALIRNAQGQLLLLKVNPAKLRGNPHGAYWDLPGGRIQRGSSVEDTLRREVTEETGLTDIASVRPFAMVLSNLRIPQADSSDVGLVLAAYLCEIPAANPIRLSDEHTEFAWFSPAKAAELLRIKYPPEFTDPLRTL